MDPARPGPAGFRSNRQVADGSFRGRKDTVHQQVEQRRRTVGPVPGSRKSPPPDDLTAPEVKYFWSFHDGSIMNVDIRQHLWRSWGFCPRHTWALAVTEPPYRLSLHGTVILYEDLTGRAVKVLRRPGLTDAAGARRLRSRDSCFACDFVAVSRRVAGERDPKLVELTRQVNKRERFMEFLTTTRTLWWPHTCPECLGGTGPVCRQHILAGAPFPDVVGTNLEHIRGRLHALAGSMRWKGPVADDEAKASLVEALGWFAGWEYPAVLLGAACGGVEGRS